MVYSMLKFIFCVDLYFFVGDGTILYSVCEIRALCSVNDVTYYNRTSVEFTYQADKFVRKSQPLNYSGNLTFGFL